MRLALLFLAVSTSWSAERPAVSAAGAALIAAERAFDQALFDALRSDDPRTIVRAANSIVTARAGAGGEGKGAERPTSLADVLVERLIGYPVDRPEANKVRWACHGALVRIRYSPDEASLKWIEGSLGRPAALLLATFQSHARVPFLCRALEAPDPIDVAHVLAWNELRIHDEEALARSCWAGIRVRLVFKRSRPGDTHPDFTSPESKPKAQQLLGGTSLRLSPQEGDTALANPDLALLPVWMRWSDERGGFSDPNVMPLAQARYAYLLRSASIDTVRSDRHARLLEATRLHQQHKLQVGDEVQERRQIESVIANTIDAWRETRRSLAMSGEVQVEPRHPPIEVTIDTEDGAPNKRTIEAPPAATPTIPYRLARRMIPRSIAAGDRFVMFESRGVLMIVSAGEFTWNPAEATLQEEGGAGAILDEGAFAIAICSEQRVADECVVTAGRATAATERWRIGDRDFVVLVVGSDEVKVAAIKTALVRHSRPRSDPDRNGAGVAVAEPLPLTMEEVDDSRLGLVIDLLNIGVASRGDDISVTLLGDPLAADCLDVVRANLRKAVPGQEAARRELHILKLEETVNDGFTIRYRDGIATYAGKGFIDRDGFWNVSQAELKAIEVNGEAKTVDEILRPAP